MLRHPDMAQRGFKCFVLDLELSCATVNPNNITELSGNTAA